MGIEDGKNGYIIPFDMGFDVTKLLKVPEFTYEYDNKAIKKEWDKLLKKPKPKKSGVRVRILVSYKDMELGRIVNAGEIITVSKERAKTIVDAKYGEAL